MDVFFVILITTILYALIVYSVKNVSRINGAFLPWGLFIMHHILTAVYLIASYKSSTDSVRYYRVSSGSESWIDLFGTGTPFMDFISWPFTHALGLSYYASMYLFSFFGLVGIYLLYVTAKENINPQPLVFRKFGLTELVFLLPNLHFWSCSLGKGSVMTLGIGMVFWGLSRFNRRMFVLILGSLLIYFIRPHILFAIAVGAVFGLLFSGAGIKPVLKWGMMFLALVLFYFISDDVVEFADVGSLNILDSDASSNFHQRVESLQRANSGIDINSYSLPMKLFTFWFRPLFFDSPGFMGYLSSFENLFYIYMFVILIKNGVKTWSLWNGWFKICFFVFLFGSLSLAQASGNLGIAMRQKAQMMPLFFLVFCKVASLSERKKTASFAHKS